MAMLTRIVIFVNTVPLFHAPPTDCAQDLDLVREFDETAWIQLTDSIITLRNNNSVIAERQSALADDKRAESKEFEQQSQGESIFAGRTHDTRGYGLHSSNRVIAMIGLIAVWIVSMPVLMWYFRPVFRLDLEGSIEKNLCLGAVVITPAFSASLLFYIAMRPEMWHECLLLVACWESLSIWCFYKLVMSFLGDSSEHQLETLALEEPSRMWASPPLCCIWVCWYGSMSIRTPTSRDISIVYGLVLQFVIVNVLLATIGERLFPALLFSFVVKLSSFLLCLYALLCLVKGACGSLGKHKCHSKLLLLKAVLSCCILSKAIAKVMSRRGVVNAHGIVAAWIIVILAIFACMSNFAFVDLDLRDSKGSIC